MLQGKEAISRGSKTQKVTMREDGGQPQSATRKPKLPADATLELRGASGADGQRWVEEPREEPGTLKETRQPND